MSEDNKHLDRYKEASEFLDATDERKTVLINKRAKELSGNFFEKLNIETRPNWTNHECYESDPKDCTKCLENYLEYYTLLLEARHEKR